MEDNENLLDSLIDEIEHGGEINIEDIPCVDLYMDQVTSFFEDKLGYLKRSDEDKILTKTMVNNYTKAKILMPSKKKKYTKSHIILLTLIYNLKQILSINDISALFKVFIPESSQKDLTEDDVQNIEKLYSSYLKIKSYEKSKFREEFKNKIELIKTDDDKVKLVLAVLMLMNEANMRKRMAEKIIDKLLRVKSEE